MSGSIFLPTDPLRSNTCNLSSTAKTAVLGAALLLQTLAAPAHSSTYMHRAPDGTVTFSDVPVSNGVVQRTSYSVKTKQKPISQPCKGMKTAQIDSKGVELEPLFEKTSASTGLTSTLLKAVARVESCFDASAQSHAGAQGLMQLMPDTAKDLGVTNSFNIEQNIDGGARYLAQMVKRYPNNLDLALAAYNAGPSNVDRYNGVPPFDETRQYIRKVKEFMEKYANTGMASF